MRTVLITGGGGFIGSNIAHALTAHGDKVYIIDSFFEVSGANHANLNEALVNNLSESDLMRVNLTRYIKENEIDVIIHCAAISSHSFAHHNPQRAYETNVHATQTLLEAVRSQPHVRLINLGTTTQYGRFDAPLTASTPQNPTDYYSLTKVLTEKMISFYRESYELSMITLRLPNIYGPRAPLHDHRLSFINYFIGLALQDKPLTVYGNGAQKRTLLHVYDVCDLVLSALELDLRALPKAFTVGSDDHISVADIAEVICTKSGGEVSYIAYPKHAKSTEVGDQVFPVSLTAQVLSDTPLNWFPQYRFEGSVGNIMTWYKTQLSHYVR